MPKDRQVNIEKLKASLKNNLNFQFPTYAVGGWVRDMLIYGDLNQVKDLDLAMIAPSLKHVELATIAAGGHIHVVKPEYLVVRAKFDNLGDVDITLARKDGVYSDGRRPEEVFVANSIEEDLSRRDATINAIAVDLNTLQIVDPFNGVDDIFQPNGESLIRSVGAPDERIKEDYLRLLRYFRLYITKPNMTLSFGLYQTLGDMELWAKMIECVSKERIRDELFPCFKKFPFKTIATLSSFPFNAALITIFNKPGVEGLWLEPTFKK